MFGHGCWDDPRRRGAWQRGFAGFGFDPRQFWGPGGPPWGRRGGPWGGNPWGGNPFGRGGRGRMFDQGDLKYVILQLLAEKPRHGYEIIKEVEERFGGAYSPSPGTVYPTLTMLEDMGYAKVIPEDSGKKVYEITDEGRKYLADNRPAVDDIFARISEFAQNIFGEPMMRVHRAFKELGSAVYIRDGQRTPEEIQRVGEILDRAAAEIRAVGTKSQTP